MRTALCCIIKNENLYIKQFVDYYRNLGFSNIILFDNNDSNRENLFDVIAEDIYNGFVLLYDIKDKVKMQVYVYNFVLNNFKEKYDWIAFFDCDEYLCLNNCKTIDEYIDSFPKDCDCIQVNWMNMSDNDLLYYDDRKLIERFTKPIEKHLCIGYEDIYDNGHIKSIIKTTVNSKSNMIGFCNPHFCMGLCKTMNSNREIIENPSFYTKQIYWEEAYLKHFTYKTISEYLNGKLLKGQADQTRDYFLEVNAQKYIYSFFKANKPTKEKYEIVNSFLDKHKEFDKYIKKLEFS